MAIDKIEPGRAATTAGARRIAFIVAASLAALYAAVAIVATSHTHHRVGLGGAPLFYDFSTFYQAAAFADAGHAASAYDDRAMATAQMASFPGSTVRLPWNYPPIFQLMLMPLAALAYVPAWLVWSGVTFGLYARVMQRLVSADRLWLLLLAPAAAVNLFVGQNGLLSTALIGGGVLLLSRRPIIGGAVLGMMAYKPQLAVMIPLVLICGREWRALLAACVSAVALGLLATAVVGIDPWIDFLHKATQPSAIVSSSSSDWRSIPSVMVMALSVGMGGRFSAICHWSAAAVSGGAALWIWGKTRDARVRVAALAAAALLVTPYLRAYDLALLTLPIALLLSGSEKGLGHVERAAIFLGLAVPAALMFVPPQMQYGALVSLGFLALTVWRTLRLRAAAARLDP
jgi:hypothetical protein